MKATVLVQGAATAALHGYAVLQCAAAAAAQAASVVHTETCCVGE